MVYVISSDTCLPLWQRSVISISSVVLSPSPKWGSHSLHMPFFMNLFSRLIRTLFPWRTWLMCWRYINSFRPIGHHLLNLKPKWQPCTLFSLVSSWLQLKMQQCYLEERVSIIYKVSRRYAGNFFPRCLFFLKTSSWCYLQQAFNFLSYTSF